MARIIETKENEEIGLYTKDSLTGKVKRVGEFSPDGGGFTIGSAGIDGAIGTESDNIKFHRGGSKVLQIVTGDDITPDGTLAPYSTLARIQGVNYVNYIVGTAEQFFSGEATHSSLSSALSGCSSGDKFLIIGKTGDAGATVNVLNKIFIEGVGNKAELDCNLVLGSGSSKSLMKYIRFLGNLTIENGSNNNIITDCWMKTSGDVLDLNVSPNNLITLLQEDYDDSILPSTLLTTFASDVEAGILSNFYFNTSDNTIHVNNE